MNDILTMIHKEFLEIHFTLHHLAAAILCCGLPVLVLFGTSESLSLLPLDILPYVMIILTGFVGTQIVHDSILGEKKAKTLEMLLSTRLSSYAIVIGKAIPGVVFGCGISALSYILFVVLPLITQQSMYSTLTPLILLFNLPLAYLASCDCIVTTLLIPDEKTSPIIGLAVMVLLFYLGWKIYEGLLPLLGTGGTIAIITLLLLIFCTAFTMIAAKMLRKVHLFTKP